jgi:hypothetical protein
VAVNETLLLGCYRDVNDNKSRYAKGTMHDLKVYNRAFTDDEITAYLTAEA